MENEITSKEQLLIDLIKFHKKIYKLRLTESERKSLEKTLGKSISILKGVLSSIVDLVFVFDRQGKFIFYHSPHTESLYLPPEEFMGKKHSEVMPPHLNAQFENGFKKNKNGEIVNFEYWLEFEGKIRWYLAKLSPIFFNTKFEGSAAAAIDITGQKELENKKQESEEKYRLLIETMTDGIAIHDGSGMLTFVNDRTCEILGYSRDELIGHSALKFVDKNNQISLKKQMKLRLKGIQNPYEIEFKKKNGHNIPVIISPQILSDQQGNYRGSFGVITDISKQKQAEQDLKKYQEHLEELVEKRTAKLKKINIQLQNEIQERKKSEIKLMESDKTLQMQKLFLEEKNIALQEIISQIESEKRRTSEQIQMNAELLIFPILENLKQNKGNLEAANLIQHHLEELCSQFGSKISSPHLKLTPRELEICNMIKAGLYSKEISKLLNISTRTVEKHRRNIRHKLGISKKRYNLTSYLREM